MVRAGQYLSTCFHKLSLGPSALNFWSCPHPLYICTFANLQIPVSWCSILLCKHMLHPSNLPVAFTNAVDAHTRRWYPQVTVPFWQLTRWLWVLLSEPHQLTSCLSSWRFDQILAPSPTGNNHFNASTMTSSKLEQNTVICKPCCPSLAICSLKHLHNGRTPTMVW